MAKRASNILHICMYTKTSLESQTPCRFKRSANVIQSVAAFGVTCYRLVDAVLLSSSLFAARTSAAE